MDFTWPWLDVLRKYVTIFFILAAVGTTIDLATL